MKKINQENLIERIVKERVEENKNLFNEKELEKINSDIKFIRKIYLLGLINGRNIYKTL